MFIYADEAGTFAKSIVPGSWCVVAALVVPEASRRRVEEILRAFKIKAGFRHDHEVKGKDITEDQYVSLLKLISRVDAVAIVVATDSELNPEAAWHKNDIATSVADYAPKMATEEGRVSLLKLADDVRSISAQNYVEMICRVTLVCEVIKRATFYYSQRTPATLSSFRWRFDQKDLRRNHFEKTFVDMTGPLAQMELMRNPPKRLMTADYSHFEKNFISDAEPLWLPAPLSAPGSKVLLHKIWREDLSFVDSKLSPGVQIADFIAGGCRKVLRGAFANNDRVAGAIGGLMVESDDSDPVIRLIKVDKPEGGSNLVPPDVTARIELMGAAAKQM